MGRIIAVPPLVAHIINIDTDLSINDGNGVGRAGLQPLRGGLPLL